MKVVIEISEDTIKRCRKICLNPVDFAIRDGKPLDEVLDKIRTKIEQEYTKFRNKSDRWSERACGLGTALEIIDKYRKEEIPVDAEPCCESMDFPDTFEEFAKSYGIKDSEEVYTNGSVLIPVFRVKQWLDHINPCEDRMKYVQETVNTMLNTCTTDSIKDKVFRNAARFVQNAIDGKEPDFEKIDEQEPCEDCVSREFMYKLGATCIAARDKDGELIAITSIESLPPVTPKPCEDVLDEIKADIEKLDGMYVLRDHVFYAEKDPKHTGLWYIRLKEVIDILNRYRIES